MVRYVDLDKIVAEIERRIASLESNGSENYLHDNYPKQYAMLVTLKSLKFSIDTLEVKEVDLDFQTFAKEMETVFALLSSKTKNTEEEPLNWEYAIAKHFFELGLCSTITEKDCKLIWNIGDDLPYMSEEEFFKELLRRYKAQKGGIA